MKTLQQAVTESSLEPCLFYSRVSGLTQVKGDGFIRQRESAEEYCKASGIRIEAEYQEKGVGGSKDSMDRPALTELFAALRADGVKLVVVERADRLARDLMVGEIILAEFRKLGVKVVEAEGGTDLTVDDGEPTKVLIRQILGCIAQFEKSVIVQKLAAARLRIRQGGEKCDGTKPYGFRAGEQEIIARIRTMRDAGQTCEHIAGKLNEDGLRSRRGKWHTTSVRRVLQRV